jgi:hypothetical protein
MPHLISPFADKSLRSVQTALTDAHRFLVERCCQAIQGVGGPHPTWGIQTKRLNVDLQSSTRPETIGKSHERLAEVVNMLATLERLLAGLEWFAQQPLFAEALVIQCHPTTSSSRSGNDLVLGDARGVVIARCEVCDVVAGLASQNNKHRKDLRSLQCDPCVPDDGVRRYVCTSQEFATAIVKAKKFKSVCSYRMHTVADEARTVMLEICSPVDAANGR